MCEFQSLHYCNDGYVVRCKQCGHYQVAFISTMLTLTESDFHVLCNLIKHKCEEAFHLDCRESKKIIIETPAQGICILLTGNETFKFGEILERADSELKALGMLELFN